MRILPFLALIAGCSNEPVAELDVYSQAHGCFALSAGGRYLAASGTQVEFTASDLEDATAFRLQPTDLGTYVLYDPDRGYVVADGEGLVRQTQVESDMTRTITSLARIGRSIPTRAVERLTPYSTSALVAGWPRTQPPIPSAGLRG
jgi:hypothetical protein